METIQNDRDVLRDGKLVDIPEERLVITGKEERLLRTQKIPVSDDRESGLPPDYFRRYHQAQASRRMLEMSRDAAMEAARLRSEFIRT